jgi:hypothetical protein
LTEKRGLFLGVLAAKRGFRAKKMTLFFAFFAFFAFLASAKHYGSRISGGGNPPKKIIPKRLW